MKTTVICLAGKRIEARISPTAPGHVLIQLLSADRQVQASATLDPSGAAVLADALGRLALAAENDQRLQFAGEGVAHG